MKPIHENDTQEVHKDVKELRTLSLVYKEQKKMKKKEGYRWACSLTEPSKSTYSKIIKRHVGHSGMRAMQFIF